MAYTPPPPPPTPAELREEFLIGNGDAKVERDIRKIAETDPLQAVLVKEDLV